ncbi:hypothetical protein [Streptomyces venezuelae]|uniref:hypothetical protein n=1 Tax=Streptomyces venezuelae TaxID=54571 RepID=UPI0037A18A26
MKRILVGAFTAATIAAGGLALTSGTSQAQEQSVGQAGVAAFSVYTTDGQNITAVCTPWQDTHTYGVKCNTSKDYYAWAKCRNGKTRTGVVTDSNRWSYAYCSTVNSSLSYGKGKWAA